MQVQGGWPKLHPPAFFSGVSREDPSFSRGVNPHNSPLIFSLPLPQIESVNKSVMFYNLRAEFQGSAEAAVIRLVIALKCYDCL